MYDNGNVSFSQTLVRYIFPGVGWFLLVVWGGMYTFNWAFTAEWRYEELGRVPSPDGRYEAVVTRASAGAMTQYAYGAAIVPAGAAFDPKDSVIEARSLRLENLAWATNHVLEVRLPPGRVSYYESTWPYPADDNAREHIRVSLIIDYDRPAAPP